ncbi:hypothetical protein E3N88_12782 [Mikania micrantha]|uniref:Uncharacterized protein n=1 Tax=Mikania micrantha TaxID=192012 RepID=A0A5N6P6X6_9ASTR|nr:hypothetical protein E3N88_12782 [Mikania micrantha]
MFPGTRYFDLGFRGSPEHSSRFAFVHLPLLMRSVSDEAIAVLSYTHNPVEEASISDEDDRIDDCSLGMQQSFSSSSLLERLWVAAAIVFSYNDEVMNHI